MKEGIRGGNHLLETSQKSHIFIIYSICVHPVHLRLKKSYAFLNLGLSAIWARSAKRFAPTMRKP